MTRLEGLVSPINRCVQFPTAWNQATSIDIFTTHGTKGIVPFTKGFLPQENTKEGVNQDIQKDGHRWEVSNPVIMKGILWTFSVKARAAATGCLNYPSLHFCMVVKCEAFFSSHISAKIFNFTLNIFVFLF